MPATYRIDIAHALMVSRFEGLVPLREAWALLDAELADPAYDQVTRHLVDTRELEGPGASADAFRTLARRLEVRFAHHPQRDRYRTAILAARAVDYGLGRMFQSMAHGIGEVAVFTDLEAACAWLDVPTAAVTERR
jgi:hypothetical protein